MFKFVAKLINKLVGQRDYSAQEVCYILFNLPLTDCSRTILNVNLCCEEDQPKTYFTEGRSVLVKYKERPPSLEAVSYLDYLLHYDHAKNRVRPQARPRILKFYPLYSPELDREDFSRVKLMLQY
ncbi:hypothetical protein CC80DRAFT_567735 [Byssothecium circinans]|uniref:Uncharacterized protein n=1 Tax=Byssothecium circinans TaxID=147558 RepID=A0A6A5TRX2_9PLEO|nr:hypothetical protein CC80DRAFT_567735 [Byssothecium circinans]